jgi:hypothetical protein
MKGINAVTAVIFVLLGILTPTFPLEPRFRPPYRDDPCISAYPPTFQFITHGFKAEYYRGWAVHRHYPDDLGAVRVDPDISFSDDGTSGTQPWNLPFRAGGNGFSVRWTATLDAPASGTYHFWFDTGDSDGGVIFLDGQDVLDVEDLQHFQSTSRPVDLSQGPHFLEIYYRHTDGQRLARLKFQPPSASTLIPIPSDLLSPSVFFGANTRSIAFTNLSAGTILVDQFANSEGVRFGSSALAPNGSYMSRPTVVDFCPNFLYNDSFDASSGRHDAPGRNPLTITFALPQFRVQVFVGTQQDYRGTSIRGAPRPPATLRAYDSNGELLGVDHLDSVGIPVTALLEIGRWQADIAGITISFDGSDIGERIASISFEGEMASPVVPPDSTPPLIQIVTPREGENVPGPQVVVRAAITEDSGLIDSVAVGGVPLMPDASVASDCHGPFCQGFSGPVDVSIGPNTIVVTARDHAGNVGQSRVHIGAGVTHVHVVGDWGGPVRGAEVYLNKQFVGGTDSDGRLDITPGAASGQLVVRWLLTSLWDTNARTPDTARAIHIYWTNLNVNDDGSTSASEITDPTATQELSVRRTNTLIGLHLRASLEWDASLDEFRDFANRIQQTSQFLYNATDGQIYVEEYDLQDDSGGWDDADFQVHADQCLRSNVPWHPGGFWGSYWLGRGRAQMGPNFGSGCFSGNGNPKTFAHEFGHYGFDLNDEYSDNDANIRCTANLGGSGSFGPNGSQASSMMDNQWIAGKLCSDRRENPHVHNTNQGDESCWHHVAGLFSDPNGLWTIRTPDTRGAIPGELPALLWSTSVETTDNAHPSLCDTLTYEFAAPDGHPLGDASVVLVTSYGLDILEGRTDGAGIISVRGGHVGDELRFSSHNNFASTTITDNDCRHVINLGDISLPVRRIVASLAPFELAVTFEPTTVAGEALLRIGTTAPLGNPPTATIVAVGGRERRTVELKFDAKTRTYVGEIDKLPPLAAIRADVVATDKDGHTIQRGAGATVFPAPFNGEADLASLDGHLVLHIPGDAVPKDTNVTIGPSGAPLPKLEENFRVVDGPYDVMASSGERLRKPGFVRFFLSNAPGALKTLEIDPATLTVRHYDSATGAWEIVKSKFLPDVNIVTLQTDSLGSYMLTARATK